jgi:uncharacterized protein involved in type VI secretion and phage assembly
MLNNIQFKIQSQSFVVIQLKGFEELSQPFMFKFLIKIANHIHENIWLQQSGFLYFFYQNQTTRIIAGIIIDYKIIRYSKKTESKWLVITFSSQLQQLKKMTDPLIFVNKSIADIVKTLFSSPVHENSIELHWHLNESCLNARFPLKNNTSFPQCI